MHLTRQRGRAQPIEPRVTSSTWKFMYTTTKIYGVKFYSMDLVNDERTTKRDPRNASELGQSNLLSQFRPVWTKFTKMSAHAQQRLQFVSPFSIWRYLVLFRRYIAIKLPQILMFWGRQFFWGRDHKFLTQFYKFGSLSSMCQNMVTIDRVTSEIRC